MIFSQIYKNLVKLQIKLKFNKLSYVYCIVKDCDKIFRFTAIFSIFVNRIIMSLKIFKNTNYERKNWIKRRYYLDLS